MRIPKKDSIETKITPPNKYVNKGCSDTIIHKFKWPFKTKRNVGIYELFWSYDYGYKSGLVFESLILSREQSNYPYYVEEKKWEEMRTDKTR